jgi:hypothetical protein
MPINLDKLKELREELCRQHEEFAELVRCEARIRKELAGLHKKMLADDSVSKEYVTKIEEIIKALSSTKLGKKVKENG